VRHFLEDVDLDSIDLAALRETIERIEESQKDPVYGPLSVKELKRLLVSIRYALE
jgi:hypothetical protein